MNVVSADKLVNINVVSVKIVKPIRNSHFAPYLSNNDPVIGFMKPMTIAPGNNMRPEWKALNPSMFCIYNGKMTVVAIIEAKTIIPRIVASVNTLYLNTRNSRMGSSSLSCLEINK